MAIRSLALVDLLEGKYRDAKAKLSEALLLNLSGKDLLGESRNHLYMSIVLNGEGNAAVVERELDKASTCLKTMPPQVWLSAQIGVSDARCGSIEKAWKIFEDLRKNMDPNNPNENMYRHLLEGEIELAGGNRARGLDLLLLADRDEHTPLSIESLARAQRINGKSGEAVVSYEEFIKMSGRSVGWEPQQDWIAAHIDLAKLYMEGEQEEKARRVLQKFLSLWKSADPGLPLLKEARRLNEALAKTAP
jgi:tetratricopeptide (TPR) repeat protein